MSSPPPKFRSRPLRTKSAGHQRTCRHPGCNKRLSMYNPHDYCFSHFRKIVTADYRYL